MSPLKKRSALRHWSEYLGVRLVAFIFRGLPLPAAVAFGRGLGGLLGRFDRRHRDRVISQLVAAYHGELTERQAEEVARRMYRHFGTMLAEFVRIPTLNLENVDRYVDWDGWDVKLAELLAEGKGAVIPTGHVGNWEVGGAVFVMKGLAAGAVARPLDNPLLDTFVRSIRESPGGEIWDKVGALRKTVRVIKQGRSFGILVDQDAGQRGLFVPFFGIESSTIPTHADLAIVTGAPIMTFAVHRVSPMRFIVRGGPVHRPDPSANREEERRRLLRLVNEDLEAMIRLAPEQWLWLHRRWKTRPPHEREEIHPSAGVKEGP